MTGVFGIFWNKLGGPDSGQHASQLESMGRAMTHQPWFQVESAILQTKRAWAGLGRLGIGLLNAGPQPVFSEDRQVALVMSGEFYHHAPQRLALAKDGAVFRDGSFAELALRAYLAHGPGFVEQLEGLFTIAVWDGRPAAPGREGSLFLFNDRFGFKPLYYAVWQDKFIFAPEMKGILQADPSFPRKLNWTAVAEILRFQQLLGQKTFFEGMSSLHPASVLRVDCGADDSRPQVELHSYWDWRRLCIDENLAKKDGEVFEESERLLRRAVQARLDGQELPGDPGPALRPGLYLSGGLDSRTLLAMATLREGASLQPEPSLAPASLNGSGWAGSRAQPERRPLTTLTYGRRDCRDVHLAGRIARVAGADHHAFDLPDGRWVQEAAGQHLELVEGTHNWVHVHGLSLLPQIRRLIDVNLFGIGGDTVLSNRFIEPAVIFAPDEEAFLQGMYQLYTQKHMWPGLTDAEAQRLWADDYRPRLDGLALESLRQELTRFAHPDFLLRNLFFNIINHDRSLVFNHLGMSSAYIEGRLPYYDYRLVEFLASLPLEAKAGKRIHKELLRRSLPRLSLIPYDKDNRLPTSSHGRWAIGWLALRLSHLSWQKLIRALGQGRAQPTLYADYENYLRGELRGWAEELLFDGRLARRGFFRPETLRSLFDRHLAGQEEWTIGKVAPIMTLEMVLRRFFDL